MDISEQVLISTLAQLVQKDVAEGGKKQKQEQKAFEVVKTNASESVEKVDTLGIVEREIIKMLLLYGNVSEIFEGVLIDTNSDGEVGDVIVNNKKKVYEEVYLSMQEDEIEFATVLFRGIYNDLVNVYLQKDNFNLEQYLMHLKPEFAQEITDIIMNDEKYVLHNWEGQNIFPKTKLEQLNQYVTDVMFTLRNFLISQYINNAMYLVLPDKDNSEMLIEINSYNELKKKISYKTGRVVVQYNH